MEIASGIVEWLLRFSKRCLYCGQNADELLASQTFYDRYLADMGLLESQAELPFTCHHFALSALLPTGKIAIDVQQRVDVLLSKGLTLLGDELLINLRYRPDTTLYKGIDLGRRWPREELACLVALFQDELAADVRRLIAIVIGSTIRNLDPSDARRLLVTTLVPWLGNEEYQEEWKVSLTR